jgi:hypothetical protein
MEAHALSRYLYVYQEIKQNLLISILIKDYKQSLFWAYELYYSGWTDDLFNYIDFIISVMFHEHEKLASYVSCFSRDNELSVAYCIQLLCSHNYSLQRFIQDFLETRNKKSSTNTPEFENIPIVMIDTTDIADYMTPTDILTKDVLKTILSYPSMKHYNELFDTPVYDNKSIYYDNWIYYAGLCPLWNDRINECNGTVDQEKKTVVFKTPEDEETFYNSWNYELDEQSKHIQEQREGVDKEKKMTLASFMKKFGYVKLRKVKPKDTELKESSK